MYKSAERLPERLSDLLETSLQCLDKIEFDPLYEFDQNKWYIGYPNKVIVGLVGSVLAMRFDVKRTDKLWGGAIDTYVGRHDARKLTAINFANIGLPLSAVRALDKPLGMPEQEFLLRFAPHDKLVYGVDPDGYREYLRHLARGLAAEGL